MARNPLFVCREAAGGGFEYAFGVGDRATLTTGPGRPPVLHGGVFGFDDLRDVAAVGEELLLATRLGVWRHDAAGPTVHTPAGGAYRAAGGAELTDLGSFLGGRPGDPPVLVGRDRKRAFARTGPDVWEERQPSAADQREFGTGAGHGWRLRLADGRVSARTPGTGRSPPRPWTTPS